MRHKDYNLTEFINVNATVDLSTFLLAIQTVFIFPPYTLCQPGTKLKHWNTVMARLCMYFPPLIAPWAVPRIMGEVTLWQSYFNSPSRLRSWPRQTHFKHSQVTLSPCGFQLIKINCKSRPTSQGSIKVSLSYSSIMLSSGAHEMLLPRDLTRGRPI